MQRSKQLNQCASGAKVHEGFWRSCDQYKVGEFMHELDRGQPTPINFVCLLPVNLTVCCLKKLISISRILLLSL